jgi:hypothetical protein
MVGTEADEVAVEEAVGSEVGGEAEVVEEEEGNGYGRSMSESRSFPSKSVDGDCFSSCIEAGRFDILVPNRVQWGDPRGAHLLDTQIIEVEFNIVDDIENAEFFSQNPLLCDMVVAVVALV